MHLRKVLTNLRLRSPLTLSQTPNLRLSKLKEFANDSFKLDENGRKVSK